MFTQPDRSIAALAAEQAGHGTRAQLLRAGLNRSTISRRAAAGHYVRVGPSTFRLASYGRTATGDVVAACLETGGVASHWTAAWVHHLTDRRRLIDVTVERSGTLQEPRLVAAEQPLVRVHSSTNLPVTDIVRHGPIALTSVARTALGLAGLVPRELAPQGLANIVGQAVDGGLATDAWLWHLLTERRCRGRNGVIALEAVLAERAHLGPTESWLEREVLRVLQEGGLPLPVTQRVVRRRGRFAARVDFLYGPEQVVLEAMGYTHHRTRAQMEADTRRANELQLLGFDVYQFTTGQVVGSPGSVLATTRSALDRRRDRDAPRAS